MLYPKLFSSIQTWEAWWKSFFSKKSKHRCPLNVKGHLTVAFSQKDFSALLNFSVGDVVEEFSRTMPFLFQCLLSVVVSNYMLFRITLNKIQCIVPKLAMVYSILMSLRFHELSRMKRLMSVVMLDANAHEKVRSML